MANDSQSSSTSVILDLIEDAKQITKQIMNQAPGTGTDSGLIDDLVTITRFIKMKRGPTYTTDIYFAIFDVADLLIEANRWLGYSYFQYHYDGWLISYLRTSRYAADAVYCRRRKKWCPPLYLDLRRKHNILIGALRDLYRAIGGELTADLHPMMMRPHPLDKFGN